jgi:hypothetical protein
MKLKIIETTDSKYEGEIFEAEGIAPVGSEIEHKGTKFKVTEIKAKGQYITFYCVNYVVLCKVVEM